MPDMTLRSVKGEDFKTHQMYLVLHEGGEFELLDWDGRNFERWVDFAYSMSVPMDDIIDVFALPIVSVRKVAFKD